MECRPQKMVFNLGIPKGMKKILEETLVADDMRTILKNQRSSDT